MIVDTKVQQSLDCPETYTNRLSICWSGGKQTYESKTIQKIYKPRQIFENQHICFAILLAYFGGSLQAIRTEHKDRPPPGGICGAYDDGVWSVSPQENEMMRWWQPAEPSGKLIYKGLAKAQHADLLQLDLGRFAMRG